MKKPICSIILVLLLSILFYCSYRPLQQPKHWPIQYPMAHFSIDDVRDINISLQAGNKRSIFEEPILSQLKEWHKQYGIVASLYIQGPFLINSRYAEEIKANSDWLRWGYHGEGEQRRKRGVRTFARQLKDSIGTMDVMDKSVRVDYYHADLLSCLKYRLIGVKAFLTADDWSYNAEKRKTNYYLPPTKSNELEKADILYDPIHDITFAKTDIRVENSLKMQNITPRENTDNNQPDLKILFTHEWTFYNHIGTMDTLFRTIINNGYHWGFPF